MAKQIKTFGISGLTVGATSDFHNKVNELIVAATPAALHIAEQATAYAAAKDELAAIVNRATAFIATAGMKEDDKTRDRFIGLLSTVARAHTTNPPPTASTPRWPPTAASVSTNTASRPPR